MSLRKAAATQPAWLVQLPIDCRDANTEGEANYPSNPYVFLSQQVKKDGSFAQLQLEDP